MTDVVQTDQDVVAKGEFAKIMKVTPGRVSQWISEGKVPSSAMVGEGRKARIRVSVARPAVLAKIDPGQAMGNGQSTVKAALDLPTVHSTTAPPVFDEMAAAKLRKAAADADAAEMSLAEKRGELVPTALVVDAMTDAGVKIARSLDELSTKSDEIYAIAKEGGPEEVRRFLRTFTRDVRNIVADVVTLPVGDVDVKVD